VVYYHLAVSGFGQYFCVLDVVFYRYRESLVANALDARETWLCFCVVFVPLQMPQNIQGIAKRRSKIHHKLYAFVERRSYNYLVCRRVFGHSEKRRELDLWSCRNYVVFDFDYAGLQVLQTNSREKQHLKTCSKTSRYRCFHCESGFSFR